MKSDPRHHESTTVSVARMARKGIVNALLFFQLSTLGHAEDVVKDVGKVGPWSIQKYEWDGGHIGRDYCRMVEKVGSDELQIMIGSGSIVDVLVKSPKIKLKDDFSGALYVIVNSEKIMSPANGESGGNTAWASNFDMDKTLALLGRASTLTFGGYGGQLKFPLPQISEAVAATRKCVKDEYGQ